LLPVTKHWWEVTEWFTKKTHDRGRVDEDCDEQELRSQFELFELFLVECTRARSFYSTTDELDEILEDATPEQVDKAVALLIHPEQRSYFFNRLQNPKWIAPLDKKGFFNHPPQIIPDSSKGTINFSIGAEFRYLARMAGHEPEVVLKIALNIKTNNPGIHEDFVDAALQMPPEVAVKLVPQVKSWIESSYLSSVLPEKVGALIVHLAKGGRIKKALELARSLLAVMPDSRTENGEAGENRGYNRSLEPQIRFDNWDYQEILKKYVPELVKVAGETALKMLGYLLYDAVNFSQGSGERREQDDSSIWEDSSIYWRPVIEEHSRNSEPYEVKQLLAIAVRDAAEQIVENDLTKRRSLVLMLEKWRWRVFHRIALYLIRKYPDNDRDLLTERLVDQKRFSNSSSYEDYEYVFLAKEYFGDLPEEEQEKILGWIENHNFDLSWWEDQERRARWVKYWQRNKLTPIKDSLPAKWQQRYQQLVNECGTTVELPDIVFRGMDEVRVGPVSPKRLSELASMSNEELIFFLKTWQPNSRDSFEPCPAGLGLEMLELAKQNPERFALLAEQFQGLRPEYGCGLIRGLRNALTSKRVQQEEVGQFPWLSILKLCRWLVEEHETIHKSGRSENDRSSYWSEACRAVGDFLEVSFTVEDDIQLPFNFRSEVWNTLKPLTQDPDPTPEHETRYGGSNMNPSELSINTVRGQAMHVVVRYALWLRRHFEQMPDGLELIKKGFDEMPEVRQVLDEHLDIDQEPSLAIRSVYGQWFPWLTLLDPGWATQSVGKIFPQDEMLYDLRRAAWETYITSCPVYDNVFNVLHEEYNYAIEQINAASTEKQQLAKPDERLAQHLMTLYWRGKLNLDNLEGLLTRFYAKAPDALRGYALEFVGRSLRNTKEAIEPQILNQLQLLWEHRLEAARTAAPAASHTTELAAFGWWFASGKFDDSWAIEQLKKALELVGQVEPDDLVVDRLAVLAEVMPDSAVECLKLVIEKGKRLGRIYFWRNQVKTILAKAIQGSNHQTRQSATALINRLGELGNRDFRELLSAQNK
jgi:hypothetical protein